MRRTWRLALAAALAIGSIAIAACGDDDEDEGGGGGGGSAAETNGGEQTANLADCKFTFGLMAPITGDAATIGEEQRNWAQFSLDRFNEENGTSFAMEEGDTQLDPAQASTVAQQMVSNQDIAAIVGPAGSQEVEAAGPIFDRADLAYVAMSATATQLSGGDYEGFARVVPSDAVQGPTDAAYMTEELGADNILIIDDQTSYSTGLADVVEEELNNAGVTVRRESVRRNQTDFSAIISAMSDEVDIVFLPWQIAANAQQFGQQLQEQGKEATIFGSDGVFAPGDFSIDGSYISSFAPDITTVPESQEIADAYTQEYGEFGTFGPPTFVAAQVVMTAAKQVCEGGNNEPSREDIKNEIKNVTIEDSILGQPIAFEENGDVKDAKFFIFTVENGEFVGVEGQ